MSEADDQIEAMNRLARQQAGSQVDDPDAPPPDDPHTEGTRKNAPWIELPRVGRPLAAFAREAAAVCSVNGVYRRNMDVVTVNQATGQIERLDADDFRTYLEDLAVTFKWCSGGKNQSAVQEETTMAKETAQGTLKSRQFIFRQRQIERVHSIAQPIMRADGKIELLQEGYDESSGVLTRKSGIGVSEYPLAAARNLLTALLKDFPFVSELDRAVQIASMLSFYGAMLLPLNAERMNFAFKANKHRSGKTLLIKASIVPVAGMAVIEPWPDTPKDLIELLNTTVNDGLPYLVLDDITGHVRSPALNAFLTANVWGFRGYHTQNKKFGAKQAVVFLSGHEMTLQADLEGRFLECRLHVAEADSHAHRVPNPINERWLARHEQRADICSALWSIIKAWDAAGRPKGKSLKPGFEDWCLVFGGMVEFAGFGDPCASRPDEERSDNEYSDMAALVALLLARFDEEDKVKEFTFGELLELCVDNNLLTWKIDGAWKTQTEKVGEGTATHRWYQPSKKCESALGWLFADKYGGTDFVIAGRKVRFSKQGKNRGRRYTLELRS